MSPATTKRGSSRKGKDVCPISTKFGFLDRFFIKVPVANFTEIRSVETAPIHVDRQTKLMKIISVSRDCAKKKKQWNIAHLSP